VLDDGAAMKETKTVQDYLVPFQTQLNAKWFLEGGKPPSPVIAGKVLVQIVISSVIAVRKQYLVHRRTQGRSKTVKLKKLILRTLWTTIPGLKSTCLTCDWFIVYSLLHDSSRPPSPTSAWGSDTTKIPHLIGTSPPSSRPLSPTILRIAQEFEEARC
jgi:hypothetical protein